MVFHVLNRGVGRRMLFTKDEDFLAFERVIEFPFWLVIGSGDRTSVVADSSNGESEVVPEAFQAIQRQ